MAEQFESLEGTAQQMADPNDRSDTPQGAPVERAPENEIIEAPPESVEPIITSIPEPLFAARVPPPEPARPLPEHRRVIFFDVENSSRADHIRSVLSHLGLDWRSRATEVIAVGNWRVVSHETARMLAARGAHLVHSAPSAGVKDWSDLRIAVAAGVWLAAARPGDSVEIVTDDQAFDAVGDVAASLGVTFRRLSYRALIGMGVELPVEEPAAAPRSRRRRRGGRGRRAPMARHPAPPAPPAPVPASPVSNGVGEPEAAPPDEIVAVIRELIAASPDGNVSLDTLSNALKARGFRRPPGSLRLITRLRRIKEIEVSRNGTIRLVDGEAPPQEVGSESGVELGGDVGEGAAAEGEPQPARRRRRRRGGRGRRRGRGGGGSTTSAAQ